MSVSVLLQFGKLDESERRTEEYDTLVGHATINYQLFLCDMSTYADCLFLYFFPVGHEVSLIPPLPTVCRRGSVCTNIFTI